MTVASLWKALDRAGCGKRVGAKDLQDHLQHKKRKNPWNVREMEKFSRSVENYPALAVDLSIWICEALTSSAMQQNHVIDPALQLVYCRVLKLLNLGIKLVVVIEGKRRINQHKKNCNVIEKISDGGNRDCNEKVIVEQKFRKRRSGARFWTACQRCEEMLKLLGVVVVRAKAEGEALCALLSASGIVDGVISNDGDCLLFGAKVLYTKFSVENLDKSKVIRYDASDIHAIVDDNDSDKYDETGESPKEGQDIVKLSRKDLIAFAILTGSDIVGDGLSKVGCRKAIRFIRKCQIDNPLKLNNGSSPSLDQLISWGETASFEEDPGKCDSGPYCSCCGHSGTKKTHREKGCEGCGTEPGELCFQLSPGGRFRKSLRAKALAMRSSFDPVSTISAYHEPNENQVPMCLIGKTARTLKMCLPQFERMIQSSFIVRGYNTQESRDFLKKSLSAYLARQKLFGQISHSTKERNNLTKTSNDYRNPIPVRVSKLMVRNGKSSCEVKWTVKVSISVSEENPVDLYEFSTIEEEWLIKKCYPKLIQSFQEEEQKLKRQGTTEQDKRRAFLVGLEKINGEDVVQVDRKKQPSTRKEYFEKYPAIDRESFKKKGISDDVKNILAQTRKKKREDINKGMLISKNDGSNAPLREITLTNPNQLHEIPKETQVFENGDVQFLFGNSDDQDIDDSSTIMTKTLTVEDSAGKMITLTSPQDYACATLTPGHIHYLSESVLQINQRRHCMRNGDREVTTTTSYKKAKKKNTCKQFASIIRNHNSNGTFSNNLERPKKVQKRSKTDQANVEGSMVGGSFLTTDQTYPIDSAQIFKSCNSLLKRRKTKSNENNYTHFGQIDYSNKYDVSVDDFSYTNFRNLESFSSTASGVREFGSGKIRIPHTESEYFHEHLHYESSFDLNGDLYDASRENEDANGRLWYNNVAEDRPLQKNKHHQSESNEVRQMLPSYVHYSQDQQKDVGCMRICSADKTIYNNKDYELKSYTSTMVKAPVSTDKNVYLCENNCISKCNCRDMLYPKESIHRRKKSVCCCNLKSSPRFIVQRNLPDLQLSYNTYGSDLIPTDYGQDCMYFFDNEINTDLDESQIYSETSKYIMVSDEIKNRVTMKIESCNRRAKLGTQYSKYAGEDCWNDSIL